MDSIKIRNAKLEDLDKVVELEDEISDYVLAQEFHKVFPDPENASAIAAAPAASGGAKEAKAEEKKEEEKPSESAAGLSSLFG